MILWATKDTYLPKSVLRLQKRGLEIAIVPEDIGPYKKYIYAKKHYRDKVIAVADDDETYGKSWLKGLYQSYKKNPKRIHFYRGYMMKVNKDTQGKTTLAPYNEWKLMRPREERVGHELFPSGGDGNIYGPLFDHPHLLDKTLFMDLAPQCDDIWWKAMSLLSDVPAQKIKSISRFSPVCVYRPMYLARLLRADEKALCDENVKKGRNNIVLSKVIERYPKVLTIISENVNKQSSQKI